MQTFVKSRNDATLDRGTSGSEVVASDLKVPVRVPRAVATSRNRDRASQHPRRGEAAQIHGANNVTATDGKASAPPKARKSQDVNMFDDTDTSVLDERTSTTSNFTEPVGQANVIPSMTGMPDQYQSDDNVLHPDDEFDDYDDLQESKAQVQYAFPRGTTDMDALIQQKGQEAHANGFTEQYLKGDSYPDTTPGWPSEVSENDIAAVEIDEPQLRKRKQHGSTKQPFNEDISLPSTNGADVEAERATQPYNSAEGRIIFTRPDQAHEPVMKEVEAVFTMQRPPSRAKITNSSKNLGRGYNANPLQRHEQHSAVPSHGVEAQSNLYRQPKQSEMQRVGPRRVVVNASPQKVRRSSVVVVDEEESVQRAQANELPTRSSIAIAADQREDDESLHGSTDDDPDPVHHTIDYDAAQLFNMEFNTLKEEDFDHDPASVPVLPDSLDPEAPLAGKLGTVCKLEAEAQTSFCTSLNIDDWEEAGDWFLKQFGQIMTRLKGIRRSKREAARSFEAETEERHVAVMAKRRRTEDALAEMRMHGAQILASTPKKLKT